MPVRQRPTLQDLATRAATLLSLFVAANTALAAGDAALSPDDIWKRTAENYATIQSYSDTGTVVIEGAGINDTHRFTTRYQAPRSYFLEFIKTGDVDRYVIWSDAEAFHTWWKTTGVVEDYPRGTGAHAFGQAGYLTKGSALVLAPLFFSQSGLQGPFINFEDLELEGSENVGGHDCYKIAGMTRDVYAATGREVNIHKLSVWIDKQTFLIIKIYEGPPKGTPPAQAMYSTTTFDPVANPQLNEASFKFDAPEAN